MTTDKAIHTLTQLISVKTLDRFREETGDWITADRLATDLVTWFNCSEPDRTDVMRLLSLAKAGRFRSWDCPTCTMADEPYPNRVYVAEPTDWRHFQGALQADYSSYPGYGIGDADKRCYDCRMQMVGAYIPEGMHLEFD
jgi:hypothetical protein